MRGVVRAGGWLLAAAALIPLTAVQAQISEPTEEDIQTVPPAFRPDARTRPDFKGFAPRGTPAGYTPSADPRDSSCSDSSTSHASSMPWVSLNC